MHELETMIRLTRPGQLPAGAHRDELARDLSMRRRKTIAPWSPQRYAFAVTAGIVFLIMVPHMRPNTPARAEWAARRADLAELLPPTATTHRPAIQPQPIAPARLDPAQVTQTVLDARQTLAAVMLEFK